MSLNILNEVNRNLTLLLRIWFINRSECGEFGLMFEIVFMFLKFRRAINQIVF